MIRDEHGNAYPAPGPFYSLDEIRREHRRRGGYYFEADTGRFFRARYAPEVYAGCMFVDSVRAPGMPREYRVKIIGSGRSINTVAEGFETLGAAREAAVRICYDAGIVHPAKVNRDTPPAKWGSIERKDESDD